MASHWTLASKLFKAFGPIIQENIMKKIRKLTIGRMQDCGMFTDYQIKTIGALFDIQQDVGGFKLKFSLFGKILNNQRWRDFMATHEQHAATPEYCAQSLYGMKNEINSYK